MSPKTDSLHYAVFPTAIGPCAIAWSDAGIVRLQLPEATEAATRARIEACATGARAADPPPRFIRDAVRVLQRHLEGDAQEMRALRVDMAGIPEFQARVFEALRGVVAGRTVTYAELARLAGSPRAVRAVGQAMAHNPLPIVVPCHRVLAAGGRPGGFSAYGGRATKAQLLALEGVTLGAGSTPDDEPLFAAQSAEALPYDGQDAVRHIASRDARLAGLIEKAGPFALRLKRTEGAFAALAESIVYQQLNGKAAATILARVKALFPSRAFFTPRDVLGAKEEDLRRAGLSRSKLAALRDLAEKAERGVVPPLPALAKMSDAEIVEHLTQVRGVGPWTVEMFLIFRLGRPDVWPVTDYGVRLGFQTTFGTRELPNAARMHARAERWRPYRSVAAWYMWRAVDLSRRAS